jgi:hypothetical protein
MTNQRDYIIDNVSGSAFRTELNQILGDIQTTNSGASAPTTTIAYKLWVDTTNNKLKIRNSSNNGWVTLGSISENLGLAPAEDPNFTGKSITLPAGNDANRPSGGALSQGDLRLNTQSTNHLEFYSGAAWLALASGAKFEAFGNDIADNSGHAQQQAGSTTTHTFIPEAGKSNFLVICTGGGGGAAGVSAHGSGYWGSSGGGGAGTAIRFYNKTEMGASATCVVGAGGATSNNAQSSGNSGADSVFTPTGTGGITITGQSGGGASAAYNSNVSSPTAATEMSRPGWPQTGVNGMINIFGEKGEFQTINNYTGTTASGFNKADLRSSGGGTFWGKGPGAGGDGAWSSTSVAGAEGIKGIIVVLSW